jgi:hypothetical protein
LNDTIVPQELRIGPNSTFFDIGSGFGKCVFHAHVQLKLKKSVGIEYIPTRYRKAVELKYELEDRGHLDLSGVEMIQVFTFLCYHFEPQGGCHRDAAFGFHSYLLL